MKIGFIQFQPALGELQKTIETLDRLFGEAENADLIVLPELCNSGYNFDSYKTAFETSEEITDSRFIDFLVSKASANNQFIVSGFNERDGGLLYNSAVLIGPSGYIGKYRKLHLFMNEKDYFQPGNSGLPVFDLGECKIGMLVCFDWIFPETWRVLAVQGADVICHPSNLVLPGLAQKAVPVQSLMNRVYIITANRVGQEKELKFTGLSTITDPGGGILLQASEDEEKVGIIDADINMARDKNITPRNNIFSDRRPGEYLPLVKLR